MSHLRLVHSVECCEVAQVSLGGLDGRLNHRDLLALADWMNRSDAHGYRRMLVEAGVGGGLPEDGGYVLLYSPGESWAQWGLRRVDDGIVVWHCSSGADLARLPTMLAALESLPPAHKGGRGQDVRVRGSGMAEVGYLTRV